jgi:hypothetical protein
VHATREGRVGEGKHDRPRQEASIPGREPAPGDEVEPGTQGAAGERIVCVSRPERLTGWLGDSRMRRK